MTSRRRNLFVLLIVAGAVAAALAIVAARPTKLGLDLRGGIELVYQARPTPKVPAVTPQAIDDALETIRKRTDQLGVGEPEIQRSGQDQISVGLPSVENADRAIQEVGTTAQLQFYDWEPNVIGGGQRPFPTLFEAATAAGKAKPRAEAQDIPAGPPDPALVRQAGGNPQRLREIYDRRNDSSATKLYLFNSQRELIAGPDPSCAELLSDFEGRAPTERPPLPAPLPKGTQCAKELRALGGAGPPAGSRALQVPQGIVVIKAERPESLPANAPFESYWVLEDDSELSGNDITNPSQSIDPQLNQPVVSMEFTDQGRRAFAAVTKRIAQRGADMILPPGTPRQQAFQSFAITLDNQIVSRATIDFLENPEGIDGRTGAQITGVGNIQQAQALAEQLRIGALPIELKLISQTQVSASLGQQALSQGLLAGGAGLLLTLLFLIAIYRVLGVVAGVALVIYAVLLYAIVDLIPITLTLPGIAGLILTLGVAADANIVIFERIKEEARAGRSVPAAIAGGYAKALRTIVDANVVTILVAFILFTLATAGVKGFAFTLGVGTLVSLFTAVLATSAILGSMNRTRLLRSRFALGASRDRPPSRFDFTGASKWFFSMSGAILAAGALAIAGFGLNFGIDFASGTRIQTPLERPATPEQVRSALAPLGLGQAEVQAVQDPQLGPNIVQISTEQLGPERVAAVRQALNTKIGVREADFTSSSVGPTFGAQVARTAVYAIIASLLLISLYIGIRFEWKYAVPVLIALAHDLLITAGVYGLTEREVTTSTVAALLTILGYSLYDTIIVFDRIRENVPRMPRATFSQIVNRSMSEVLTRSLVTSSSTLFPIIALMLFGGATLGDFGFALLVGVASGTYSSIFIAAPVLTAWKERETLYRRRRAVVMQDHGGVVPAFAASDLGSEGAAKGRGARAGTRRAGAVAAATGLGPDLPPEVRPGGEDGDAAEAEPEAGAESSPSGSRANGVATPTGGNGAGNPGSTTGQLPPTSAAARTEARRAARRKKHGRQ